MVDPTAFGYAGFNFSWGDHICTIFDDPDQQMMVMVPFMTHGIRAGQRCVWASPPTPAERFRKAMGAAGCDLVTLEASGQLIVISDIEFYLQDGLFEPSRTLALGRTLVEDGRRQGYPATRIAADVSWVHDRPMDAHLWEQYEHRVTLALADFPAVAVCQYDRRRFPGSLIVTALYTHPIVILGETLCRNPYFVQPPHDAIGPQEVL